VATGVLVLAALAIAAIAFLGGGDATDQVTMPDLVGEDPESARNDLQRLGLVTEFNEEDQGARIDGVVGAQDVDAGDEVAAGTTVTLDLICPVGKAGQAEQGCACPGKSGQEVDCTPVDDTEIEAPEAPLATSGEDDRLDDPPGSSEDPSGG
jgi:hypothetical protein